MRPDLSNARIFIRPGHTDMRKVVKGLTVLIQEQMDGEPFSGNLYIFCSRDQKLLESGVVGEDGILVESKRLERMKYPWPGSTGEAEGLSVE